MWAGRGRGRRAQLLRQTPSTQAWAAAHSVALPQSDSTSLLVWQKLWLVPRYRTGAQLRYCTSVRRHSSALAQGRRQTPSRQRLGAAHCESFVQKGWRRVSATHTPSLQKRPAPHSVLVLQRVRHEAFTHRRPVPQSASWTHSLEGALAQTPSAPQRWPAGHGVVAEQAARHC